MGKDQQAASATMDVDAWKAFGGKVDGKVYVAPGGEDPQGPKLSLARARRGRGGRVRTRGLGSRAHRTPRARSVIWRQTAGERLKSWKAAAKLMSDKQKDAPASGERAVGTRAGECAACSTRERGTRTRQGPL